jgi:Ca2+-transporting ATPase
MVAGLHLMIINNFDITGLTEAQVVLARSKAGKQRIKNVPVIAEVFKSLAKEPMVILLLSIAIIYLVSGQWKDAIVLCCSTVFVVAISLYQDSRSRKAMEKLKEYNQPACKVIREGKLLTIKTTELVVGDHMVIEEGKFITADGSIIHSNDFAVNESLLTGEAVPVFKDKEQSDHSVYQGTTVSSGLAIVKVTAIGAATRLGKIAESIDDINVEETPLEIQIGNFVKKMVILGVFIFVLVWAINFFRSFLLLDSLLKALTLAMSILPEEIPVAFTTFMALGTWRLMKMGVIVKQMKTVETLGTANVICTDKTGTLTENKMTLARLYVAGAATASMVGNDMKADGKELIRIAMWASEPIPFDPMEIALHKVYSECAPRDERTFYRMLHEYPLDGRPPMMTHIFESQSHQRIIAAKGAVEAITQCCQLTIKERNKIELMANTLAEEGFRVLAVAESNFGGNAFPQLQQELPFIFRGLVAFYDPPKKNIALVLKDFYEAGIDVKIITGDHAATTLSIAKLIGLKGFEKCISGEELLKLPIGEIRQKVLETVIFTRMFPEAKLRVINILKAENQIVAMVGDGVNDGPALKAAHIGIAMGTKGTELAKESAAIVLINDDLAQMVSAIAMGRRIYGNLKKAIRYIISIHIPIILIVFIPLALGWRYPVIFLPLHVIFLELIMGPTCSIIYENEPMEENGMKQQPRPFTSTLFNGKELLSSVTQGLIITTGALAIYLYAIAQSYTEATTRTMVFSTLIWANVFLTLVNRSFYYSFITTLRYRNNLLPVIIVITLLALGLLIYVKPFATLFQFQGLSFNQFLISTITGFIAVIWFEAVKWIKRLSSYN